MKRLLLYSLLGLSSALMSAQTRYLEEVFTGVIAQEDSTVYQQNYSIFPRLAGQTTRQVPLPNYFQAYRPAGDDATDRPVMIINGTGSYLPRFVGGGVLGSMQDSALVETAKRFARRGYVAVIADNRQGWFPAAFGSPEADDVRVGSLLIAAYKGIQDMRALARYLRRTVAEEDNPLGINPDQIGILGYGTGGYNAYNTNFLDNSSEVFDVSKYYSDNTGLPYLDTAAYGGPDGLDARDTNLVNHPGYDSRFQVAIGIGGAVGDTTWADGNENEAPTIGMHDIDDRNAPYSVGNVSVPVGGQSLFVINAHGARAIVETANRLGINDELEQVNAVLAAAEDFLTLRMIDGYDEPFRTRDGVQTTLTTENMYAFVRGGNGFQANTYNYIDSTTLSLFVAGYRALTGDTTSTATYLRRERISNANITDPAAAKMVLDTIMDFVTPRAYVALGLGDAEDVRQSLGLEEVTAAQVGFRMYPNPADDLATIEVDQAVELQLVALYDALGRRVASSKPTGSRFGLNTSQLPVGLYRLYAQTSEGILSEPLMVTR